MFDIFKKKTVKFKTRKMELKFFAKYIYDSNTKSNISLDTIIYHFHKYPSKSKLTNLHLDEVCDVIDYINEGTF